MTPAILLAYATVTAAVGGSLLQRCTWMTRLPRLGVLAWQAASASVLLALVLAGGSLVLPRGALDSGLAQLLDTCIETLRAMYDLPGGGLPLFVGLVLSVGVTIWTAGWVTGALVTSAQRRGWQSRRLRLVASRQPGLDALVVDSPAAVAYCVPGRHRAVVLTSAALATLSHDELEAVLAHERAHLRERHHLVISAAEGIARAFPGVPLFRTARSEIARLLEMRADDVAARQGDRFTVASALLALAGGSSPAATLAAGGARTHARVARLITGTEPVGLTRLAFWTCLVVALPLLPVALAAGPALGTTLVDYCIPPGA